MDFNPIAIFLVLVVGGSIILLIGGWVITGWLITWRKFKLWLFGEPGNPRL